MRKPTIWVPTRSDTNQVVHSQKMVRAWKFWNQKVKELYYLCSENKGTDQLRSYCEADLHLCFCLCRLLVFICSSSNSSSGLLMREYGGGEMGSHNSTCMFAVKKCVFRHDTSSRTSRFSCQSLDCHTFIFL